jgi:cytochrome c biogenesis protein CcmG, thiol:disulfide interchange protein DsbE
MSDSNRRQWMVVAGVLVLLAALVGAGWTVRDRFLPVEVGTAAPNVKAADLAGRPVTLGELKGQVVLLNLWATWCPPCREEMPSMQRLHQELGDEGLRIVAVSVDAAAGQTDPGGRPGGDVAEFVNELNLTFPVWHQPSGDAQRAYRTTGLPESFLIGKDGRIVKKVIGATEWDSPENVALIRRLLEE